MKQTNKNQSYGKAIFVASIGFILAASSLAHNLLGVLPRITADLYSTEYFIQIITEGGKALGLNIAAISAVAFAMLHHRNGDRGLARMFIIGAVAAIIWSSTTQLGVITEKTFAVAGTKNTAKDNFERAKNQEAALISKLPSSYKFLGEAKQLEIKAKSALLSHKYGSKSAWETTNHCKGEVTAPASKKLCKAYDKAKRDLEKSNNAYEINAKLAKLRNVINKGQPPEISSTPELIAEFLPKTSGITVKKINIFLAIIGSLALDLLAGAFWSSAMRLWPTKPYQPAPSHQQNGGLGVQSDEPDHPDTPKNTRVHSQQVINDLKQSVQNTEHAQNSVFKALQTLSIDGKFETNYRDISALTKANDGYGVATGALNEVLKSLVDRGLIERDSSKGKGTCGRILAHEHDFA